MSKDFDVVIYGASGFTGRLVAEYMSQQYPASSGVSWAMAGRNAGKLAEVRDEIGAPADTPLVVADASDPVSLKDMVDRAGVICTTVGPYQLYGPELVAACAESGTDYVDLCGEPAWMRHMIDAHEVAAKESGARIVFSCGFDSIPFDLGVSLLQERCKNELGSAVPRIKGRVRSMKGSFSGGTAASLKATMAAAFKDPSVLELLKSPFALTPGFEGPKQPKGTKPEFDEELQSWAGSFVMAPINTKNVHRTNFLTGHAYGTDFIYDEMMLTGPGEKGQAIAEALGNDTSMMGEDAPKPGEGPDKEERENGSYDVLFIGEAGDGTKIRFSVSGDKDPGYGSTSKMIAESAVCLTDEAKNVSGGIWTPASAMCQALSKRLEASAGLKFVYE